MKRFAILASLIAALALPALALAAIPPAGKWTTKIATPAQLKGTWALSFARSGAYTITLNGKLAIRGHGGGGSQFLFTGETGPFACPSFGAYTWKRKGKTLTFKKAADDCVGRAFILSHPFTLAS
jgi:hypothetical protein